MKDLELKIRIGIQELLCDKKLHPSWESFLREFLEHLDYH